MSASIQIPPSPIYTIGHSTRTWQEFVDLLKENEINLLLDVRRYPSSRRFPHFNKTTMAESLALQGIEYLHLEKLGGRHKPLPDSKNIAWRNQSFRGYADYMSTESFEAGMRDLLELSMKFRTVVMCAEAVWWRCHRALIADYLKARSIEVLHILGPKKIEPHPFTSAATVRNGVLSYSVGPGQGHVSS